MAQEQTPHLVLIVGGARSGKSTFAEQLASTSGKRVAFIATATASDADMGDRIARHRASRPPEWTTIEEPLDLLAAVQEASRIGDVLLLDCMTLWLSNWMGQYGSIDEEDDVKLKDTYTASALAAIEALLTTLKTLEPGQTLIIVTNEVGLGIIPMHPLSRVYRDLLGWINQRIARDADRVYLMVAGLAVDMKHLSVSASR
ncbi:MAG: bifunctional adenosylcobinamide kinase/adenosylcobinamide-phosphate guanylyltransferase [Ktedonobacteraceae bacterium]